MGARLENSSIGTKEWLEVTQGWTISAYVDNRIPAGITGAAKEKATIGKKRRELPFGENIRDTIRTLRGA